MNSSHRLNAASYCGNGTYVGMEREGRSWILRVLFFRLVSGKEYAPSRQGRNPLQGRAMRIPEHPTQIRAMLDARRARLAPKTPALAGTSPRCANAAVGPPATATTA